MGISINDNYCVTDRVLTTRSVNVVYPLTETQKTVNVQTSVNYSVAGRVPFATKILRQPQKKGLSPLLKKKSRNKVCELCFFCRSVCFCPICSQCPQCCSCSPSRRLPTAFLADFGPPRGKSQSGVNFDQRSKLGFYVPFNSQGHIGTGPQNCHLWDSNPQR